jgi:hypothetical protein
MTAESEYALSRKQLETAEKAKQEYLSSKTEESLGLKIETPVIAFDGSQVQMLDSVLKDWQKRIEDGARIAAQNYVKAALKTRDKDMECFRNLNDQIINQKDDIEQFLVGVQEAIIQNLSQNIMTILEEIRGLVQKPSEIEPLQRETLLKLNKVLDEYT